MLQSESDENAKAEPYSYLKIKHLAKQYRTESMYNVVEM